MTNSYIIKKSDVFCIDNVRMLSRAFLISGGAKSSSEIIEFDDTNNKTFCITGVRYHAVKSLSQLYDTLQYSAIVMKICTDKSGFNNYYSKSNHDKIEVIGIQIGNKSYIALSDINREKRRKLISTLVFVSVVFIIILIAFFIRASRFRKKTYLQAL